MTEAAAPPQTITLADFSDPTLAAFLQAHLDDLVQTSPPESCHALDLGELQADGVRLFVTRHEGRVVATGAIAVVEEGHEELKSMRTDPALRGQGVGRAMLHHLLDDARARGVRRVSLETGPQPFFAAAHAIYSAAGFTECEPFGTYRPDPEYSLFMTREL